MAPRKKFCIQRALVKELQEESSRRSAFYRVRVNFYFMYVSSENFTNIELVI